MRTYCSFSSSTDACRQEMYRTRGKKEIASFVHGTCSTQAWQLISPIVNIYDVTSFIIEGPPSSAQSAFQEHWFWGEHTQYCTAHKNRAHLGYTIFKKNSDITDITRIPRWHVYEKYTTTLLTKGKRSHFAFSFSRWKLKNHCLMVGAVFTVRIHASCLFDGT